MSEFKKYLTQPFHKPKIKVINDVIDHAGGDASDKNDIAVTPHQQVIKN